MSDPCPKCGKDRALVGHMHLCVTPADQAVTHPVTSVTKASHVTAPSHDRVTKPSRGQERMLLTLAQERISELEGEVKRLKRQLAEAHGGGKPKTGAERMRDLRARRKDGEA